MCCESVCQEHISSEYKLQAISYLVAILFYWIERSENKWLLNWIKDNFFASIDRTHQQPTDCSTQTTKEADSNAA